MKKKNIKRYHLKVKVDPSAVVVVNRLRKNNIEKKRLVENSYDTVEKSNAWSKKSMD